MAVGLSKHSSRGTTKDSPSYPEPETKQGIPRDEDLCFFQDLGDSNLSYLQLMKWSVEAFLSKRTEGISSRSASFHTESIFNSLARAQDKICEEQFQLLGWWKGENGGAGSKKKSHAFWSNAGLKGSEWLVERLRKETHPDLLDAAASTLADIGLLGLSPILLALERWPAPPTDCVKALLKAIGWMPLIQDDRQTRRIVEVINRFAKNKNPEIRECAFVASACLPERHARELLEKYGQSEKDELVQEVIGDLVEERSSK